MSPLSAVASEPKHTPGPWSYGSAISGGYGYTACIDDFGDLRATPQTPRGDKQ